MTTLRDRVTMPPPDISVVIPAFRAERFLAESIESVLAQELPPAEIVVVDDGSPDGTAAVAESFGAAVRVVRHGSNRGEAAARNTGVAATIGTAVAMHDADDRMLPQRLRIEADRLVAAGSGTGCVLGRSRSFTDEGAPLPPWALDAEGGDSPYGNSLVLAWRSTYEQVGGYDESFTVGTDSNWLLRVKAEGLKVVLIDEELTERRWHNANLSAEGDPFDRAAYTRSLRRVLQQRRAQ